MRVALALVLLMGLITAGAWWQWAPAAALVDSATPPETPDIVMISAKWCGYCKQQVLDFKRSGIPMRVLDVDQPEGRRVHAELNGRGVPITAIAGVVVHSYDRPQLSRELALHGFQLR
jgi:glutaredoxin